MSSAAKTPPSVDVETATSIIMAGLSTVFSALGRSFLCLDRDLNVMHAEGLDELLGAPLG